MKTIVVSLKDQVQKAVSKEPCQNSKQNGTYPKASSTCFKVQSGKNRYEVMSDFIEKEMNHPAIEFYLEETERKYVLSPFIIN